MATRRGNVKRNNSTQYNTAASQGRSFAQSNRSTGNPSDTVYTVGGESWEYPRDDRRNPPNHTQGDSDRRTSR